MWKEVFVALNGIPHFMQMKAKIFDTTVTKVNEVLIFLIWK